MKLRILALAIVSISVQYTFAQLPYSVGAYSDPENYKKMEVVDAPMGFGENLPDAVSLKQYVPKIGDQGEYGTCTGWSSTYYGATMEYAILNNITDRKEITANAFDPYYTYLKITTDNDYFECDRGAFTLSACMALVNHGPKRFGYNELTCGSYISYTNKKENVSIEFTDVKKLLDKSFYTKEENLANIKQALFEKHPVIFGMDVPRALFYPTEEGLMDWNPESTELYGGHAVTVVGYDDNKFGGCFTVVNSWGDKYGDSGYVYIRYDDFYKFTDEAFHFVAELKETKEKGCVYGDCVNGYGRYVFDSGFTYEGDFIEGEIAGYGMIFWPDYDYFGGEWEDNARHGKGFWSDGSQKWEGYWNEDAWVDDSIVVNKINQKGRMSHLIEGQYVKGSLHNLYEALETQEFLNHMEQQQMTGCIYGDCENGLGMYLSQNKYVYIGIFKDGTWNGYGEMYWLGVNRGNIYKGNQMNGYRHGFGNYYWPNGDEFHGHWSYGNRDGFGTYHYANGEFNTGTWENNKFSSDDLGFGEIQTEDALITPTIEKGSTGFVDKPIDLTKSSSSKDQEKKKKKKK